MEDFHVHSNYSDGTVVDWMLAAAEEAGLDGVGFADHCNLTTDPAVRRERAKFHRNFDLTHERRRAYLASIAGDYDLSVYDAVEVDYEPDGRTEAAIRAFLEGAGFDYAIGSVHYVGEREVFRRQSFGSASAAADFVADYYDALVALVESELFDVVAHVDLIEAHPELRGIADEEQFERLAGALADSETVPEINAGHVGDYGDYDGFHPGDRLLETLLERGVEVTIGSDAHEPENFETRVPALRDRVAEWGIEPVSPV